MKTKWIICYDISNDKTRRKVFNLLKNAAQAIQYSVFEADLSQAQQITLREKLVKLLAEEGSIRWYPLCKNCTKKADNQGTANQESNTDYFIV